MDERNDYNSIPMQPIQTAVEWLFKQLWDEPRDKFTWNAILSKAEEMMKGQIMDAANQKIFGDITFTGSDEVITKGENYYNQTYNNENTNGTSIS